MPETFRIDCAKASDREALVVILVRNGYAVRVGKEKRGTSKAFQFFVEFWRSEC